MYKSCAELEKLIFDEVSNTNYRHQITQALADRGGTKYMPNCNAQYKEPIAADMVILMNEVFNE